MFWPGQQLPISYIAINKNIKIAVISSYSTDFSRLCCVIQQQYFTTVQLRSLMKGIKLEEIKSNIYKRKMFNF